MAAPAPRSDWQFQLLDLHPGRPAPVLLPPPPPVEPGESEALRALRAKLDPSVAARVRSGAELLRKTQNSERQTTIPTTLEAVDTLLAGGLQRGKLTELVSRHAAGRFSIVLSALAAATALGEAAALIDLGDHFDPQVAEDEGIDLRRLLWVRPQNVKEAVMSAELIAATGFQLVVIDVGLHPLRGRRAPEAAWVRLARTAEVQRAALLVSSPYPLTGTASEAVLKACGTRARWLGRGNAPRLLDGIEMKLTLEKHRHVRAGGTAMVNFAIPDAIESSSRQVVQSSLRSTEHGSSTQNQKGSDSLTVSQSHSRTDSARVRSSRSETDDEASSKTRRLEDSTTGEKR